MLQSKLLNPSPLYLKSPRTAELVIPRGKEPAGPPLRKSFPDSSVQAEHIAEYSGFPRRSGRSLGPNVEMYLVVKPLLAVLMGTRSSSRSCVFSKPWGRNTTQGARNFFMLNEQFY